MEILKKNLQSLANEIDRLIKQDLDGLGGLEPLLEEVLHYTVLGGGKRIRPLLVILSARFCGVNDENLGKLAVAFEYLHAATLLHDDVIDRADKRRGRASVSRKFGMVAAILTGDFLLARAMTLVGGYSGQNGLSIFCQATRDMVDGEFTQLAGNGRCDLLRPDYFKAVNGKTAGLISAACEVGAVYAGASPAVQKAFKTYGNSLGTAFQIVDDLLDYLGDTEKIGKKNGNDLIEGKFTLPLILAMEKLGHDDRNELQNIFKDESRRKQEFTKVVELVERAGGFEQAGQIARQFIADGKAGISFLDCKDQQAGEILAGLADYVLTRNQ